MTLGQVVTVAGRRYVVTSIRPDGEPGLTREEDT